MPPTESIQPKAPRLTREEEADRDLRGTVVSVRNAWILVAAFLLTIALVPAAQLVQDRKLERVSQITRALALLPTVEQIRAARTPAEVWGLLPPEASLRSYETALEEESLLTERILPSVQSVLSGPLGAGNEQAYLGRGGWLFYRPEVDYLTSRGFLEPSSLRARRMDEGSGETAPQPDPVPAIARFRRQLAERGIELVLMPTPMKTMVHPERLSSRFRSDGDPLQNPSYGAFRRAMEREGVLVYDPTDTLMEAKRRTGEAQYLATDTHWCPEAMDRVAADLARFLRARVRLSSAGSVAYERRAVEVEGTGDIAQMLKLPQDQRLFPKQRVTTQQVYTPEGRPWRASRGAEVLLLGDSFSNIYSLEGMGWGRKAGLAEQLSYHLRCPVDRIVINAGGSHSTRERLCQELARGSDRLKGKRVVVWQFAMRDLSVGDWKLLDLPGGGG